MSLCGAEKGEWREVGKDPHTHTLPTLQTIVILSLGKLVGRLYRTIHFKYLGGSASFELFDTVNVRKIFQRRQ